MEYLDELQKKYDINETKDTCTYNDLDKCKYYIKWITTHTTKFPIFMGYYLGVNSNDKLVFTRDFNTCDSPPDINTVMNMVKGDKNVTIINKNSGDIFEQVELVEKTIGGTSKKSRPKRRHSRNKKRRSRNKKRRSRRRKL